MSRAVGATNGGLVMKSISVIGVGPVLTTLNVRDESSAISVQPKVMVLGSIVIAGV